jgi:hypothetical protein
MSTALDTFGKSVKHADRLIAGTKVGVGKPSAQEVSMFVASVALTYAAWETFVEDSAVEVTEHLAGMIRPEVLPQSAREAIEGTKPTTWELAVHPGWQALWVARVRTLARGDVDSATYGMNTANEAQTRKLFQVVGLDPFRTVAKADLIDLEALVRARGEVVHTASAPESFKKATAKGYRDLADRLVHAVDASLWKDVDAIVKQSRSKPTTSVAR